jgi:Tfp pilus assembly protein PilW
MALRIRPNQGQAGWTMISLMVGLVVSLLVILSMLSLFRVVATNVVGTNSVVGMQPTAAQDRQVATALLSVQTVLQSAGYGYSPQAMHNTQFVLVSNPVPTVVSRPNPDLVGNTMAATTTITVAGTVQNIGSGTVTPPLASTSTVPGVNAMFWETAGTTVPATAGTAQCYGLLSDTSATGKNALYLLQSSGSCSPVNANWNSATWAVTPLISSGLLGSAVTFYAQETTCWPYSALVGSSAPAGLYVQLSWSTNTSNATAATYWSSCLPNIS